MQNNSSSLLFSKKVLPYFNMKCLMQKNKTTFKKTEFHNKLNPNNNY